MLIKIYGAYVQESQISWIETCPGGFRVRFLYGQNDLLVPCPADRCLAVRQEIDAQLARADDPPPPDAAPPEGPAEPKPPRGGYF